MNTLKYSLFLLLGMLSFSAEARFDFDLEIISVESVLLDSKRETVLEIEEDTFIRNIQGYACAVPAIQVLNFQFGQAELNHNGSVDFGVKAHHEAFIVKQEGGAFCSALGDANDIFGENYVVGSNHRITVSTVRSIVIAKDWEGVPKKMLLEVVSTELLGVKLVSTASMLLEPVKE